MAKKCYYLLSLGSGGGLYGKKGKKVGGVRNAVCFTSKASAMKQAKKLLKAHGKAGRKRCAGSTTCEFLIIDKKAR